MIQCFIFDLEGVIFDHEEMNLLSWKRVLNELGIDEGVLNNKANLKDKEIIQIILNEHNGNHPLEDERILIEKKYGYYQQYLVNMKPGEYLDGIEEFLKELKLSDYKLGLVSTLDFTPKIIKSLDANKYFDYMTHIDRVKRGKPYPDVFLDVCIHLNVNPLDCVGIDDSDIGIKAINRAGMYSVGVRGGLREACLAFQSIQYVNINDIIQGYKIWLKK